MKQKTTALHRLIFASLFLLLSLTSPKAHANPVSIANYRQKPKLVVVLVIDQFRGDLLTRFESSFLPPGTSKNPGGFRYLMENGAWYPFAEYGAFQDMTCPGHATILTGSHPGSHGIGTNDWFDPKTKKNIYCAEDAVDGLSPRHLRTTTVGDELKAQSPKSRVYAVALKDRAAIMLGGHRADLAVWVDEESGKLTSSSYYLKGAPPQWMALEAARIAKEGAPARTNANITEGNKDTKLTFDVALAALKAEKLGRGPATDLLAISLSYHDILGHATGPDSKEMMDFTKSEDHMIADFLKQLSHEMGSLDNVVIAFTADHGIPPTVDVANGWKLEAGRVDAKALVEKLNSRLGPALGISGHNEWIVGARLFHFFLNRPLIEEKKLDLARVEREAKKILMEDPGSELIFSSEDFENGRFPPGVVGQQLKNGYVSGQSGDLFLVLKPFYYEKGSNLVTHMTGWSYDRSVPLILVGRPFKPGVYAGAAVVDLAPTLSFLLGALPPAKNEGRVLSETLK